MSGAIIYLIIKRKKVRIEFIFRDKKKGNEIRLSILKIIEKLILIISLLSFLIFFNLCANSLTLYEFIEDLFVKSTIFEDYYVDPSYTSSLLLPGIYLIREILEQAEYYQELFIGSYAEFGGREYFYKQHVNYNIVDYYSAVEIGRIDEDYYVW